MTDTIPLILHSDTANKIGTYQLAIAAKYHNVPFFAAVPTTTLDLTMTHGGLIHVEERPADELTRYVVYTHILYVRALPAEQSRTEQNDCSAL